jgi:NADH-quinone oxidoreductase subunit N
MNADPSASFQIIVVIISMASMTVGNIMALRQVNVKRMLAYSGISHAGFMLMTLLSVTNAAGSLLYYTSAYALTGIAAFSVILYVCKDSENEDITNFHEENQPFISRILTASLLSMAGILISQDFF